MEVMYKLESPIQPSDHSNQEDIVWNETSQAINQTYNNVLDKKIVYFVLLQQQQAKSYQII